MNMYEGVILEVIFQSFPHFVFPVPMNCKQLRSAQTFPNNLFNFFTLFYIFFSGRPSIYLQVVLLQTVQHISNRLVHTWCANRIVIDASVHYWPTCFTAELFHQTVPAKAISCIVQTEVFDHTFYRGVHQWVVAS